MPIEIGVFQDGNEYVPEEEITRFSDGRHEIEYQGARVPVTIDSEHNRVIIHARELNQEHLSRMAFALIDNKENKFISDYYWYAQLAELLQYADANGDLIIDLKKLQEQADVSLEKGPHLLLINHDDPVYAGAGFGIHARVFKTD